MRWRGDEDPDDSGLPSSNGGVDGSTTGGIAGRTTGDVKLLEANVSLNTSMRKEPPGGILGQDVTKSKNADF
jgi:hypothetical protein